MNCGLANPLTVRLPKQFAGEGIRLLLGVGAPFAGSQFPVKTLFVVGQIFAGAESETSGEESRAEQSMSKSNVTLATVPRRAPVLR